MVKFNTNSLFADSIILWHKKYGRHHLPWQKNRTPYRVWLSEIMLQQTQVATVIPYFNRFVTRFSTINSLAIAHIDEVLHLWSGLGYYSRARNLHKTARLLTREYKGQFPSDLQELMKLPGVGRSTAAAILAQAFKIPSAILDGNVKRVLSRYTAFDGALNNSQNIQKLWHTAEKLLPSYESISYTQGLMDLGATLCTRSNPNCFICPLASTCLAKKYNQQNKLPVKDLKKEKPIREGRFILIDCEGRILLKKRKSKGVWAGLWCLPEIDELPPNYFTAHFSTGDIWQQFRHTFSHYHLECSIYQGVFDRLVSLPGGWLWYNVNKPVLIGLASPIKKILQQWQQQFENAQDLLLVAEPQKQYKKKKKNE